MCSSFYILALIIYSSSLIALLTNADGTHTIQLQTYNDFSQFTNTPCCFPYPNVNLTYDILDPASVSIAADHWKGGGCQLSNFEEYLAVDDITQAQQWGMYDFSGHNF